MFPVLWGLYRGVPGIVFLALYQSLCHPLPPVYRMTNTLLENSDNFDLRCGLEINCNEEASLVRCVSPYHRFQ